MKVTLREANRRDLPFLREMLGWAANWRSDQCDHEAVAEPVVSRYVEGFGREGDAGLIAENESGRDVGAAWYRYFRPEEPGFGFLAAEVPEVTIGVSPSSRGQGIGAALLEALLERAIRDGIPALSLSVEDGNRAVRLYERVGFRPVGRRGNALTMRLEVPVRSD